MSGTLLAAGLCGAAAAAAGPISIGARAGLSVPQLRGGGNEISSGYTSRLAGYFGAAAELEISPSFSIQPEIDYVPQGGKRDGMQPITDVDLGMELPPGMTLYGSFKNVSKLDYIEVPILAKLSLDHAGRFYVDLGPYVGYLTYAKNVTSGSGGLYLDSAGTQPLMVDGNPVVVPFDATTDNMPGMHRWNWGFQGGFGYRAPVGAGQLYLDARAGLGLPHLQRNTAVDGESRTGVLLVVVGYMFGVRD